MPPLKLENFGGMLPLRDAALLPPEFSAFSQNSWLYRGTVQGFRDAKARHTMVDPTAKFAYRIPLTQDIKPDYAQSLWLEFADEFTNVIRAPVSDDSFQRYYFFSPSGAPSYNTLARLVAGLPNYILGIPDPAVAPGVTSSGGTGGTPETRAYLYTWVSTFGEEGPPSPATLIEGNPDGTYDITLTAPTAQDTTNRTLATTNIYRTVAASDGTSTYYLVASQPIADLTYTDTALSTSITGNLVLPSTSWFGPPAGLIGAINFANGMLVGWTAAREVWFCEPYRPHAWPSAYTVSVDQPIVGMGAHATSVIILTTSNPYVATGVTPSSMSMSNIAAHEPCVSRSSIVAASEGVYYASINGLILATSGGTQTVTKNMLHRHDWLALNPYVFAAARYSSAYLAFAKGQTFAKGFDQVEPIPVINPPGPHANKVLSSNGIVIDSLTPQVAFNLISFLHPAINVMQDDTTGTVYILKDGVVYEWDAQDADSLLTYVWRTKEIQFQFKDQYTCATVYFDVPPLVTIPPPTEATRNVDQAQTFDNTTQYLIMRVYADKRLVVVREFIQSGEILLLPSGFKANFWEFELEGQVAIKNLQLATSVKDLQAV